MHSDKRVADSLVERVDALYEFDREPVCLYRLEPGRHFAALFAGEHVAGPSERCTDGQPSFEFKYTPQDSNL